MSKAETDTGAEPSSAFRILRANAPLRALFTSRIVSYAGDSLSMVAIARIRAGRLVYLHLPRCIVRDVPPPKKTQVFLSINEVADLLGITVNSAKSYVLKGMIPAPDALIGRHRGWRHQTIKDWNYNRPQPSRREPDQSMLKNNRDRRSRPVKGISSDRRRRR